MASKEARLVLRLIDGVTGPGRAITAALDRVKGAVTGFSALAMAPANAIASAANGIRRHTTNLTATSAGLTVALGKGARLIYQMEDILNEIEGRRFGKNNTFTLADGVEMTREHFRQSVVDLVDEVNRTAPRTADQILAAYNQLVQAGLTHEQVHAILPTSVDFAIAGNYDTEEAADKLTNVMTSMRMPMATQQQAEESAKRAADVIAYAANITNADVRQMTESFKYAAPSAAALGISIEQLAAMFLIQARRGIKASEAGVSIRAMLTRMVRPTNMAQAALARYNIDLADYLERSEELEASDFVSALGFGGLDARAAEGEIAKVLASSERTGEKVKKITAAVMKAVGDSSTMSAQAVSDVVTETLFGFGEELDVERLISDMQAAGIAMADFFRIFDVRQGARTLALFGDDYSKWVEELIRNSDGFAEALRKTRMQGIVGGWEELKAAMVGAARAIADSGVLKDATELVKSMRDITLGLKDTNPELLKFGTYAAVGLAALAPLGWAIAGIGSALALAVNPLAWVAAGLGYLAYLNFDGIMEYVSAFGPAVQENLGPRTQEYIRQAGELLGGLVKSHEFDASGAGQQHGSWLAQRIEFEIAELEKSWASWVALGERIKGGWKAFENWWDGVVSGKGTDFVAKSVEGIRRMAREIGASATAFYDAGVQMVQSLWDGAIAKFEAFIQWVSGWASRIRAAIGVVDFGSVVTGVPNAQTSGAARAGAAVGGMVGPPPAAKRANGGPVSRGLSYVVGDGGEPELFTPGRSGYITPFSRMGGSGGPLIGEVHIHGANADEVLSKLERRLESALKRSRQTSIDGRPLYEFG